MLHVGLDLSRKRLDYHVLDGDGTCIEAGAAPPDSRPPTPRNQGQIKVSP